MRTFKCPACGAVQSSRSADLCRDCRSLVEPDPTRPRRHPQKEKLIPSYEQRARLGQPLFPEERMTGDTPDS